MIKKIYTSNSEEETAEIAKRIASKIKEGGIITLKGDLGTGKTFLSKKISEKLGIKNKCVKSPTYTYIQKHKTNNNDIYHIDLYRIEKHDKLLENEIIELSQNPKNIILIEWPERLFNKKSFYKAINIEIKYISEKSREIKIEE